MNHVTIFTYSFAFILNIRSLTNPRNSQTEINKLNSGKRLESFNFIFLAQQFFFFHFSRLHSYNSLHFTCHIERHERRCAFERRMKWNVKKKRVNLFFSYRSSSPSVWWKCNLQKKKKEIKKNRTYSSNSD